VKGTLPFDGACFPVDNAGSVTKRPLNILLLGLCAGVLTACSGIRDTSRTFETVVIDAGHGGHDSGARSRSGLKEKYLALDVARRLDARLRAAGFKTVMTRNGDVFVPLDRRAGISNRQRNALFVSVHFNHANRRSARGTETYYKASVARRTAGHIQRALDEIPGLKSRGVKTANFRVLRKARYPAVLVECGFLSNSSEADRCGSPVFREQLATKIAEGLIAQRYGQSGEARTRLAAMRGEPSGGG
jgi:N-acetylmuramoyl-L-alanine amidase